VRITIDKMNFNRPCYLFS